MPALPIYKNILLNYRFDKILRRNEGRAYVEFFLNGKNISIQSPASPMSKEAFWRPILLDAAMHFIDGKTEGVTQISEGSFACSG